MRGNAKARVNGSRKRKSQKGKANGPTRRVKHALSLGTLIEYSKTVDERFDDLDVVHIEQHHPIPRWWWITTALMSAGLLTGVKFLSTLFGIA
jgi:hypothetical protein